MNLYPGDLSVVNDAALAVDAEKLRQKGAGVGDGYGNDQADVDFRAVCWEGLPDIGGRATDGAVHQAVDLQALEGGLDSMHLHLHEENPDCRQRSGSALLVTLSPRGEERALQHRHLICRAHLLSVAAGSATSSGGVCGCHAIAKVRRLMLKLGARAFASK